MGGALTSLRLRHMTSVCIAAKGFVLGGSQWNVCNGSKSETGGKTETGH